MIEGFLGPQGAVVPFSQARQVLVVETAGKLRAIRDMIARVENPSVTGPERVTVIELKYVTADEVLSVARPLLGLTDGANSNEQVSLSIDLLGSRIFATGEADKLDLLLELVPVLDRAPPEPDPNAEEPEQLSLKTFTIKSADTQVVLRVVQTIMANMPGIRMEVDETSGKLVVLARPSEHETIQATIDELEGQAVEFEVIPLKRTDPQLAVMAINKFFNLTGGEEEGANADGPIVDGDPISMQLWVRGTTIQIDQIKDLIQKLEGPEGDESTGPTVRMIPLTGAEAESALDTIEQFWVRKNRIRMVTPSNLTPSKIKLRTVTPLESEADTDQGESSEAPQRPFSPPRAPAPAPSFQDDSSAGRASGRSPFQFASSPAPAEPAAQADENASSKTDGSAEQAGDDEPAEIRIAITPGGLLIASEDTAALDALEEMLRAVAGPVAMQEPRETTVFYLKYAKAEIADQLIQEILNGRSDEMGGSLLGDMASDLLGGGLLGALAGGLGGGGEETEGAILASGVITIVPDPRLNALIVEANPTDLETIENLLKVIDREDSITDILTAGTPRLIPVIYSSADEVANVIKQVFANKIESSQAGGQRNQPSPEDMMRALRGQRSSREASQARGEEQKMTIGVDARSNAIIVTGPQKLYEQVEAMVKLIDQPGSEEADVITVVPVRVSDPEVMQKALESILETAARSTSSSNSSGQGSSSGGGGGGPSPEDIRRRIEMFRSMQGGGMFGGRPGGSPSSSGRPSFGGGRPSGGSFGGRPGGSSRGGSSRGGR
jgi:type II secretory pathway component GspD/PulD (secretin)